MTGVPAVCGEWRDSIAGLVLGALEPDEAAVLRRHLVVCQDCALELRRLAVLPPLLDLVGDPAAPQDSPPSALEDAVLDGFARDRRAARQSAAAARRARWGTAWRGPAAGALVGAAAAAAALLVPGLGEEGLGYRFTPSPLAPGASADARLTPMPTGTSVRLRVRGLPRQSRGAVYELWFSRPGEGVSAGTFHVGPQGAADVRMSTAADLGEYRVMRILLLRPTAGPGRRPGHEVLLTGRISGSPA